MVGSCDPRRTHQTDPVLLLEEKASMLQQAKKKTKQFSVNIKTI